MTTANIDHPHKTAAVRPVSIAEIYGPIEADMASVEENLRLWSQSSNPLIAEVSRYVFRKSGKRIRPALVLLAAKLAGYEGNEGVYLSTLVEIIHTASLIHDDIIDNTRLRRGEESVHSKWGPNITVLLGDYLYIKSISLSLESKHADIIRVLSDISMQMIEGELIEYYHSGNLSLAESEYLDIIRKKTASLFSASCEIGAILAKASSRQRNLLVEYGDNLGMSFQIIDDLLDFTGNEGLLGKPVLSDFREGRITLPLIHALDNDGRVHRDRLSEFVQTKNLGDEARRVILEVVTATGALDYAFNRAREYASRSQEILTNFPESPFRNSLLGLSDFVLNRDQ
ncbi:MAG TPA: polyprenyl synthetase family protein [Candidatus Aminicenantes bacterium]|nr:polyprenyl synthetase family protein [Candidatus Aminicenantes bacterium]